RGMQMMNVEAGGDLIIDLPSQMNTTIHQQEKGDAMHEVKIIPQSRLYEWVGCLATVVNSNHHQALGRIGEGYQVVAFAPDSTVEAIVWSDTITHPFAVGVQWHPERMIRRNPLASKLGGAFLQQVDQFENAAK
ncbi:MAG: C26 family cysteine hydrolase domain-containing family, partial [Flavobacteriales bacterium]|nr:C26 family cysteine hydrolase domain-containing family [Flavobacteriales bacterium]